MLHHLSIAVADIVRASQFYDAVLRPLGYVRVWADETAVGYGYPAGGDKFAIKLQKKTFSPPPEGFHIAFSATSAKSIDDFHSEALKHGGTDNGGAGLHSEYGDHYYAAFVIDPDGYRIEATYNDKFEQGAAAPPLAVSRRFLATTRPSRSHHSISRTRSGQRSQHSTELCTKIQKSISKVNSCATCQ